MIFRSGSDVTSPFGARFIQQSTADESVDPGSFCGGNHQFCCLVRGRGTKPYARAEGGLRSDRSRGVDSGARGWQHSHLTTRCPVSRSAPSGITCRGRAADDRFAWQLIVPAAQILARGRRRAENWRESQRCSRVALFDVLYEDGPLYGFGGSILQFTHSTASYTVTRTTGWAFLMSIPLCSFIR